MQETAAAAGAREAFVRQRPTIEDVIIERCRRMLKDAAAVIIDHLASKHSAHTAAPTAGPPVPPTLDNEFDQPTPPNPSPRI